MALTPAAQAHVDQALHNYSLYLKLRSEGAYLDWALTALFYSALHLVTGHAVQQGVLLGDDHSSLRSYLDQRLVSLRRAYRRLEDGSRDTRYDLVCPDDALLGRYHDLEYQHIVSQMRARGVAF